jgi:hypothetical protein
MFLNIDSQRDLTSYTHTQTSYVPILHLLSHTISPRTKVPCCLTFTHPLKHCDIYDTPRHTNATSGNEPCTHTKLQVLAPMQQHDMAHSPRPTSLQHRPLHSCAESMLHCPDLRPSTLTRRANVQNRASNA